MRTLTASDDVCNLAVQFMKADISHKGLPDTEEMREKLIADSMDLADLWIGKMWDRKRERERIADERMAREKLEREAVAS